MRTQSDPFGRILGHGQLTVVSGAAAAAIPVSAEQQEIEIFNTSTTNTVYIGKTGVTNLTGFPVPAGTGCSLPLTADAPVYVYQNSGGPIVVAYMHLGA